MDNAFSTRLTGSSGQGCRYSGGRNQLKYAMTVFWVVNPQSMCCAETRSACVGGRVLGCVGQSTTLHRPSSNPSFFTTSSIQSMSYTEGVNRVATPQRFWMLLHKPFWPRINRESSNMFQANWPGSSWTRTQLGKCRLVCWISLPTCRLSPTLRNPDAFLTVSTSAIPENKGIQKNHFFLSKTYIVDEFWHFCSHLQSGKLFCQNSSTCYYFLRGKNWISIFCFPFFRVLPSTSSCSDVSRGKEVHKESAGVKESCEEHSSFPTRPCRTQ